MLKNDTLKNGTPRIGLYESAPPPPPPEASTLNIREVVKFHNLGHRSSETDLRTESPSSSARSEKMTIWTKLDIIRKRISQIRFCKRILIVKNLNY